MIRLGLLLHRHLYVSQRTFTTSIVLLNTHSSKSPKFNSDSTTPHTSDKSDNNESSKVEDEVRERLSKILADVPPQGGRIVEEPEKDTDFTIKPEPTFSGQDGPISESNIDKSGKENNTQNSGSETNHTKPSTLTYSDIFNIKQIIDTVKASENVKQLQQELSTFYKTKKNEQQELTKSLSKRVDHNVTELKKSISIASKVVNEITGYNKVIKLKDIIVENEQKLKDIKKEIHDAKVEHEKALELRSSSQKEVNELLERKNSWNPADLDRFTRIYMTTHDLDNSVKTSAAKLKKLEDLQESTHDALIRSIMNRYHEEQVWSDKIRQFSTWGTILIMCINLLLVFLVQFIFEPFKRWRLVNSFEGKVKELFHNSEKLDLDIQALKEQLDTLNARSTIVTEFATPNINEKESGGDNVENQENQENQDNLQIIEASEITETTEPPITMESESESEFHVEVKPEILASINNPAEEELEPLPPFRILVDNKIDMLTMRKYFDHYYSIARSWIDQMVDRYVTPIRIKNAQPFETTVGEFELYIGSSVLISTVVGVMLGHLVI